MPRRLATILNGTIVAGIVVLLHRCRTARLAERTARRRLRETGDLAELALDAL
jgi:hypothetical protein